MKRREFNKGVALVPASSVLVPFTRVAPVASAGAAGRHGQRGHGRPDILRLRPRTTIW